MIQVSQTHNTWEFMQWVLWRAEGGGGGGAVGAEVYPLCIQYHLRASHILQWGVCVLLNRTFKIISYFEHFFYINTMISVYFKQF